MSRTPFRIALLTTLLSTVLLALSYSGHSLLAIPTGSMQVAPDYSRITLGLESGRLGVFYYAESFTGFGAQALMAIQPPQSYFLASRLKKFDAMGYHNDILGITPRVTSMRRSSMGNAMTTYTCIGFSISLWYLLAATACLSVVANHRCRYQPGRGFPVEDRKGRCAPTA